MITSWMAAAVRVVGIDKSTMTISKKHNYRSKTVWPKIYGFTIIDDLTRLNDAEMVKNNGFNNRFDHLGNVMFLVEYNIKQ